MNFGSNSYQPLFADEKMESTKISLIKRWIASALLQSVKWRSNCRLLSLSILIMLFNLCYFHLVVYFMVFGVLRTLTQFSIWSNSLKLLPSYEFDEQFLFYVFNEWTEVAFNVIFFLFAWISYYYMKSCICQRACC